MKCLLIILMMLVGKIGFAHQPDLSTIIISKTENGNIVLQINSALTAFQGEVNSHNPENSYKTPEDFQKLVIKHFFNTFSMVLNEEDRLSFINPVVILGHETKLVAEIIGMPKDVNSIDLNSTFFKDIHNNQSVVVFMLEGFPSKINYTLNNDNKHQLKIVFKEGNWQNSERNDSFSYLKYLVYFSTLLTITLFVYLSTRWRKS